MVGALILDECLALQEHAYAQGMMVGFMLWLVIAGVIMVLSLTTKGK